MYSFAYDANFKLGKDFLINFSKSTAYQNLEMLIKDYNQGQLEMALIPVGALIAVQSPYHIIAQARLNSPETQVMTASLWSNNPIKIEEISEKKIGFINPFCTTSFWGLLIGLQQYLPSQSPLWLLSTNRFEQLKYSFLHHQLDLAMFWDKFLKKGPFTPALLSNNTLPTPVIIARENICQQWLMSIYSFTEKNQKYFFNRFMQPDMQNIMPFLEKMHDVKNYFRLTFLN